MKLNFIGLLFVLINALCILATPIETDKDSASLLSKRGVIGDLRCLLFGTPKYSNKWMCCNFDCLLEDSSCRSACRTTKECKSKYTNGQRCCNPNC